MRRKIDLQGFVILLVEDDKTSQLVFQGSLKTTGARVLLAENGNEALEVLGSEHVHIDVIFMDIVMPELDGLETSRRIRKMTGKYQNIPIIAWTASWYKDERQKVSPELFDHYLIKPTTKELLLETAEKWLKFRPSKG